MIEDQNIADLNDLLLALSARMNSLNVRMDKVIEEANFVTARNLADSSENMKISEGDTAWILYSTGLVIFMTIPGLAIFYAGMARVRNVLATVLQVGSICALITFLWVCFGYSLSFGPPSADSKGNPFFGNGDRLWLEGMTLHTSHQLAPNLPESVFCSFQLAFAIMTASLICTSIAHKFRYFPMLLFIAIWHFVVYCPITYSIWHPDGFLYKAGVLDWAGGYVVHITSGVSTLVCTGVVGNTTTRAQNAHNILYSFIGCCILWMGWYGFNSGSAYSANSRAATTVLNTQISASLSGLSWMAVEWMKRGKPSVLGMCSGSIAGLVCVTPAAGHVSPTGAFFIGLYGGPLCYLGCKLKEYFGFGDAFDASGVHATGGIIGVISTAFFATKTVGTKNGVYYAATGAGGHHLGIQLYGLVVVIGWTVVATYVILKLIDAVIGLAAENTDDDDFGNTVFVHRPHARKLQNTLPVISEEGSVRSSSVAFEHILPTPKQFEVIAIQAPENVAEL
jgi:Amt family ammonium transporter